MFVDKIPIDIIGKMLEVARNESEAGFIQAYKLSGSEFPSEKLVDLAMCASVNQLFFQSMIKQIDVFEEATNEIIRKQSDG